MERSAHEVLAEMVARLERADAVGVLTGSGHVIEFASARARELLGRGDDDLVGMDWVGMTPPEYRAGDDDAMREAVASGATGWLAKQFVTPDGSRVPVEVLVVALEAEPFRWMALVRPARASTPASDAVVPVAGALLRLARRLAGTGSIPEVFRAVDRLLAPALGATYANMALLEEHDGVLRIHHDPATEGDVQGRWVSIPATAETLLGDAATSGQVVICENLDELRSRYPGQGADAERLGLSALAAAPLRADDGRIIGVMGVGWKVGDQPDLDLVRACAGLLGNAVGLAESVDFDRRAASTFQKMLLPAASALRSRHHVAMRYRAVESVVGGDFYDVIERDGSVWLIIGDVAGHGLGAARTMGKTRFFLRALVASETSPSRLLHSVSQLLIDEQQSEMVTCLAIRHDTGTDTLLVATAGHPAPIVARDSGPWRQLSMTPLPPLGVRSWPRGPRDHSLEMPSRLVAFTDGFVERPGEVLDEGVQHLVDLVNAHLDASIDDLAELILKSDLGHEDDDAAVVCIQFATPASVPPPAGPPH